MAEFRINPERRHLHGIVSGKIKPVLHIDPGDTVIFKTMEPDWRIEKPPVPSSDSGSFVERTYPYDAGHALCGPVYINGADVGKTLVIHVNQIVAGSWGWSRIGKSNRDHMDRIGFDQDEFFLLWDIDHEKGLCKNQLGHTVKLEPFMGVYTVATVEDISTQFPGVHGANLDCKDINEGSTLYLPVLVQGALFSTGDGHAKQGDGELGGTAIEAPMERVSLTFEVLDETIESPVCKTKTGWITFGFAPELTDAAYSALMNMVSLLEKLLDINHSEALSLTSLIVDMKITQVVNGIRGAHAYVSHEELARVKEENTNE